MTTQIGRAASISKNGIAYTLVSTHRPEDVTKIEALFVDNELTLTNQNVIDVQYYVNKKTGKECIVGPVNPYQSIKWLSIPADNIYLKIGQKITLPQIIQL